MLWWGVMSPAIARASITEFPCEIGVQVGCGYYVGDATKMIFATPREVFGVQARYNFDSRWAMQIKAQRHRIVYSYTPEPTTEVPAPLSTKFQNPMWNFDVTAEYNFFRFGLHPYDSRVKHVTPFIALGIGLTMVNKEATIYSLKDLVYPRVQLKKDEGEKGIDFGGFYIPISIGVKWRFAPRWQLQACWQHQIYLKDNIEGYMPGLDKIDEKDPYPHAILNNADGLNGVNVLNNDLTSTLTVGVVFEFGRREKQCYFCED